MPLARRPERLLSLDVYRGFVVLLMASSGFGFAEVSRQLPDSGGWRFLARQTNHSVWTGCTFWDLIEPSFIFIVGVALPLSLANRRARGLTFARMAAYALWRALLLVVLGVFLTLVRSPRTEWTFTNVLTQIGLAYPFLFLLSFTQARTQWFAAFGILFAYWLAFALHPLPSTLFDWSSIGVSVDPPNLAGFFAHWDNGSNFAAAFDRWFLNLFPRPTPYVPTVGGYQTLNFVPALATMVFGLRAGQWLQSEVEISVKLKCLLIVGIGGLVIGQTIALAGLCPMVKRLWTPAWAIYSAGWASLVLAAFVGIIEWRGWKAWTFPFEVAGVNTVALYCLWMLKGALVREDFKPHPGPQALESSGVAYAPILQRSVVLLTLWLILFLLYRRKIFLKI